MDLFQFPNLIVETYIRAKNTKNKNILKLIYIGTLFIIMGILIGVISENIIIEIDPLKNRKILNIIAIVLAIIGFILSSIAITYEKIQRNKESDEIIDEQERKVAEHPNEPKLSWDLARIKLESYLNRNISQVKAIFNLSVFAMVVGFGLIIYGSVKIFDSPENLNASIVVAVSGLIVNFIGATFLIVYKSVMAQAKDYVNVLERINAVGMSVQIIDTIKDSHAQLKEETKAELSKKLIDLYTEKKI